MTVYGQSTQGQPIAGFQRPTLTPAQWSGSGEGGDYVAPVGPYAEPYPWDAQQCNELLAEQLAEARAEADKKFSSLQEVMLQEIPDPDSLRHGGMGDQISTQLTIWAFDQWQKAEENYKSIVERVEACISPPQA